MQSLQRTPSHHRPPLEVLGSRIFTFYAVSACLIGETAGIRMDIYPYMALKDTFFTLLMPDAPSTCYCRIYCMTQVNCTSVTTYSAGPGSLDCFFSRFEFQDNNLEPNISSYTFAKQGSSTTPTSSSLTTTPVSSSLTTTPVSSSLTTTPISSSLTTTLVSSSLTTTPISSSLTTTPVSSSLTTTPISSSLTTTPISSSLTTTPVSSSLTTTPISSSLTTTPVSSSLTTTPISSSLTTTPVSSSLTTTPVSSSLTTTPISSSLTTTVQTTTESTLTTDSTYSTTVTTTMTSTPPGCSSPFTEINNVGCLHLVLENVTFAIAKAACQQMNADLYVASTTEEFNSLRAFLKANYVGNDLWVGVKSREWFGGRVPDETEWSEKEPNGGFDDCARMREPEYKLFDRSCDIQYHYICQKASI
ncbi:uncharacterized protein [Palaemon carinicauda]|uniref:uncharacterized protein n=1 Tax=Palaemon carinicauda TaxID=392227 RepID=UPI0035B65C0F